MFEFLRRRPAAPSAPVVPWQGGSVRAEFGPVPVGPRREVACVLLTAGQVRVQLHAREVRDLARGRLDIAESAVPPLAFLCRPRAAARGSVAQEDVGHLPPDSLVLLLAAEPARVAAVLDGADLQSFTAWSADLPI